MKIDVNVGKKFTLNTGNYSSISPSVSITAHNIDVKDTDRVNTLLSDIADVLLHEQIEMDAKTMASIKKMGFGEYFKKIDREQMSLSLEKSINELILIEDDNLPF